MYKNDSWCSKDVVLDETDVVKREPSLTAQQGGLVLVASLEFIHLGNFSHLCHVCANDNHHSIMIVMTFCVDAPCNCIVVTNYGASTQKSPLKIQTYQLTKTKPGYSLPPLTSLKHTPSSIFQEDNKQLFTTMNLTENYLIKYVATSRRWEKSGEFPNSSSP